MNKKIKDLSFNELAKEFPIGEGLEKRTYGKSSILVPYKEIRVCEYEMPDFDTMKLGTIVKPHKVEMRIRIYEEGEE